MTRIAGVSPPFGSSWTSAEVRVTGAAALRTTGDTAGPLEGLYCSFPNDICAVEETLSGRMIRAVAVELRWAVFGAAWAAAAIANAANAARVTPGEERRRTMVSGSHPWCRRKSCSHARAWRC